MSYSQMYVADKYGDMLPDLEQRNGSGSGPVIWTAMIYRYERIIWPEFGSTPQFTSHDYKALFDNWEKMPLKSWERDVLLMTYDYAVVAPDRYNQMAESMLRFSDAHTRYGNVDHLVKWAERLQQLHTNSPDSLGAGLYLTSVGDNFWSVYEPSSDEDEDGEYRRYNLLKDNKHFFVEAA